MTLRRLDPPRKLIRGPVCYKGVAISRRTADSAQLIEYQGGGTAGYNLAVAMGLLQDGRPDDCHRLLNALLVERMAQAG